MIHEKSYKPNGCKVAIRNNNGVIALRYSYNGKQIDLSLGLNWLDIPSHHKATSIAQQIHNDIYIYDQYDESKEKYKVNSKKKRDNVIALPEVKEFTLNDCFEFYLGKVNLGNTEKTRINRINKLLSTKVFMIDELPDFVELALKTYAKGTILKDLASIRASINLAKTYKKHNQENLAGDLIETLEEGSFSKTIRIFTQDEINHILSAFKNDTYNNPSSAYKQSYYYGFVAIRFLTGMRPSEAIALTWLDIIDKNGKLWLRINKRYSQGKLIQGTKNGVDIRLFPINNKLKELLDSIPKIENEHNLIFPSYEGKYLDRHNFTNRSWKTVINGLIKDGLVNEYLPFYDIRHTFISLMARSGKVDLKTLACLVGNSVQTIIKNYLAIDESVELPNIF